MPRASRASIQFLGAAGTVTGSKHLLRANGAEMLLDCGLFQGLKDLRLRNWKPLPVAPGHIEAVTLSHAHIDHSGYLPRLVREGFQGPIYCTPATADLLDYLLRDSAFLQEEQAAFLNRHRLSKHKPALPLYTVADAEAALALLQPRPYDEPFETIPGVRVTYRTAGHILGAATVDLAIDTGGRTPQRVVFTGDLGRYDSPILRDPAPIDGADLLISESTYGDSEHPTDVDHQLARAIGRAADRGGAVIVPAFAVGRTQELLWRINNLEEDGLIPVLPVYLDSPMATFVTDLYRRSVTEHDREMREELARGDRPLTPDLLTVTGSPEESKKINDLRGPIIIISASGMATGGRVVHHLKYRLPDRRTTVLLTGFQAAGTRGRTMADGAATVRIHGQDVPIRATIDKIDGLSAHADRTEFLRWFRGFRAPPHRTYLVHGEPNGTAAFAADLTRTLGWKTRVAADGEKVEIG